MACIGTGKTSTAIRTTGHIDIFYTTTGRDHWQILAGASLITGMVTPTVTAIRTDSLTPRSSARVKASRPSPSASLFSEFAAGLQAAIFVVSGSVALLADLIHNFGDALTAIPLGIAFFFRSFRGEKLAGRAVVLAIFVSACVALYETIQRFIHPRASHAPLDLGRRRS